MIYLLPERIRIKILRLNKHNLIEKPKNKQNKTLCIRSDASVVAAPRKLLAANSNSYYQSMATFFTGKLEKRPGKTREKSEKRSFKSSTAEIKMRFRQ